jgi:hypothetical protein
MGDPYPHLSCYPRHHNSNLKFPTLHDHNRASFHDNHRYQQWSGNSHSNLETQHRRVHSFVRDYDPQLDPRNGYWYNTAWAREDEQRLLDSVYTMKMSLGLHDTNFEPFRFGNTSTDHRIPQSAPLSAQYRDHYHAYNSYQPMPPPRASTTPVSHYSIQSRTSPSPVQPRFPYRSQASLTTIRAPRQRGIPLPPLAQPAYYHQQPVMSANTQVRVRFPWHHSGRMRTSVRQTALSTPLTPTRPLYYKRLPNLAQSINIEDELEWDEDEFIGIKEGHSDELQETGKMASAYHINNDWDSNSELDDDDNDGIVGMRVSAANPVHLHIARGMVAPGPRPQIARDHVLSGDNEKTQSYSRNGGSHSNEIENESGIGQYNKEDYHGDTPGSLPELELQYDEPHNQVAEFLYSIGYDEKAVDDILSRNDEPPPEYQAESISSTRNDPYLQAVEYLEDLGYSGPEVNDILSSGHPPEGRELPDCESNIADRHDDDSGYSPSEYSDGSDEYDSHSDEEFEDGFKTGYHAGFGDAYWGDNYGHSVGDFVDRNHEPERGDQDRYEYVGRNDPEEGTYDGYRTDDLDGIKSGDSDDDEYEAQDYGEEGPPPNEETYNDNHRDL